MTHERATVGYARVSDRTQERDGYSLPAQQKRIRAYAESMGWPDVAAMYVDTASGKTDARPQYQRLLRDAREGRVGRVIVVDLDRLDTLQGQRDAARARALPLDDVRAWCATIAVGIAQYSLERRQWLVRLLCTRIVATPRGAAIEGAFPPISVPLRPDAPETIDASSRWRVDSLRAPGGVSVPIYLDVSYREDGETRGVTPAHAAALLAAPNAERLTTKERAALEWRAQGLYYRDIGAQLGICRTTVQEHVQRAAVRLNGANTLHKRNPEASLQDNCKT